MAILPTSSPVLTVARLPRPETPAFRAFEDRLARLVLTPPPLLARREKPIVPALIATARARLYSGAVSDVLVRDVTLIREMGFPCSPTGYRRQSPLGFDMNLRLDPVGSAARKYAFANI